MRGYKLNLFKYATFPSGIKSHMSNYLDDISRKNLIPHPKHCLSMAIMIESASKKFRISAVSEMLTDTRRTGLAPGTLFAV